jgi:sigma-B regulation protein RsbU (phosphoserine phosphatase)
MNGYLLLSTLNLILGGLVFLLGFVIYRENPGQRLNRLVALMLFCGGFGAVLAAIGLLASGTTSSTVGAQAVSQLLQSVSYVWEFYFPALFMFASVFPEERRYAHRSWKIPGLPWRAGFGVLVFAPHVFHVAVTIALSFWPARLALPTGSGFSMFAPILVVAGLVVRLFLLVHQALFSLVNLGFGIATMLLLFGSYRRATVPRLRQQLGVITLGLSASLVCYSLATSIPALLNLRIPETLRSVLTIVALTLGPGSIAYAVVRYKFLDTKLLARRGILYALASAALVGIYLIVVGRLQSFIGHVLGADSRVVEPVLLIVALAMFQPAIAGLEQLVDQMFLKDPNDYRNVVRQLGRELPTTIDLDELLTRTAKTLNDAMLLRSVHVVAFTRQEPVARSAPHGELPREMLVRLAAMLPNVSAQQPSYRLADRVDGLSLEDQDLLRDDMAMSLLVPLRWRGEMVGALLLSDKVTGMSLTSEDVALITGLAAQLSVSLQNAQLLRDRVAVARFEEELNLARQIQRTLLLSEFPQLPGCEVHAMYHPSKHVGGDFYDVVETADGCYLLAIADVSGKGVPAALLSSMLQASLRTQAGHPASLAQMLGSINSLLYRSSSIHQFATFFLARLDTRRRRIEFSNAGHNWPVVSGARGGRTLLERGGTVLGIFEQVEFEESQIDLIPGDRLVCYTDGVTEAMNRAGEDFGEERLYQMLDAMPPDTSAREIAERLFAELHAFLDGIEAQDDVTLLVLRVLEPVEAPKFRVPETEDVAVI